MVDIKRLVMKVLEPIISATIEDSLYYIAGSDVLPPPLEPAIIIDFVFIMLRVIGCPLSSTPNKILINHFSAPPSVSRRGW